MSRSADPKFRKTEALAPLDNLSVNPGKARVYLYILRVCCPHGLVLQVALWQLSPQVYSLFPTDVLHNCYNGICKHLFSAMIQELQIHSGKAAGERLVETISSNLYELARQCKGLRVPVEGLLAQKRTGQENRHMMLLLSIASVGIVPASHTRALTGKHVCVQKVSLYEIVCCVMLPISQLKSF